MNSEERDNMGKEDFLKNIKSTVDPDMSEKAMEFYREFFPDYIEPSGEIRDGYRGDCMISLGWTFGSGNKEKGFDKTQRSYTQLFQQEDIQLFCAFREGYHSKANFAILPQALNLWRGSYRKNDNDNWGYGSCDYFDILLNIIRLYFLNQEIPGRAESYVLPYRNWLDSHGTGNAGWKHFIDKNYFNPFVNDKYEVKDLFASAVVYKREDCHELVGTYHDFDWCLPLCAKDGGTADLKTAKERALNFARNSLWIWEKRAEILAK